MAKIKCTWIACIHNTNKCEDDNDCLGECTCQDEIVFTDTEPCGECGYTDDALVCSNFQFKPKKEELI